MNQAQLVEKGLVQVLQLLIQHHHPPIIFSTKSTWSTHGQHSQQQQGKKKDLGREKDLRLCLRTI
jgi:hypothetical protein